MKKKITISFFTRKPIKNYHFSIENFYKELLNFKEKKIEIIQKELPFESKGILKRVYLIIWSFFNQENINHISGDINFINFFLNKKKNILTILDLYSLKRLRGLKRFIYKLIWLEIPIRRSSKIITISENIKKELCKNFILKKNIIEVIPCSISKIFKINKKKLNLKNPHILFIGTAENKNLIRAIKVLKNLNVKITIIGKLKEEHLKLLSKNKIRYQNFINQSQKQIYSHYVKSDILFYPSIYEGFGIPILEAQAVGRLVITSTFLKETAGKGAIYVNPLNVNDMRNKIVLLIRSRKKIKFIINEGFKNLKKYKLHNIRKKYIKVYKSFYEDFNYY